MTEQPYTIRYAYRHNNKPEERYIAYSNDIPALNEVKEEGDLAEKDLLQSCVIAKPSYKEAKKELIEVVKIMMSIPNDEKAHV